MEVDGELSVPVSSQDDYYHRYYSICATMICMMMEQSLVVLTMITVTVVHIVVYGELGRQELDLL